MFEQKVNRCQNYKLGLSLVDSVTEKKMVRFQISPHFCSQKKTLARDYKDITVKTS